MLSGFLLTLSIEIMNTFQIIQEATRLIRANRIAWLYICVSVVSFFLYRFQTIIETPLMLCISLIVSLSLVAFLLIFNAGLVYDISQRYLYQKAISISDSWSHGKVNFWRIIGLSCLFFIPIGLFCFAFWIIFRRLFSPVSILGLSIQFFFAPLFAFGMCGIMINQIKPSESAAASLRLLRRNFSWVIFISGTYILGEKILLILLVSIISLLFPIVFSFPLNIDLPTYNKLMQVPIIALSNSVLSTIIYPWEVAIFTIAYLNFIKVDSYPVLAQEQTNILSKQYINNGEPNIDWLGEFVLKLLEQYGIQSFDELQATTHIDADLLQKVLSDLKNKQLVDEHIGWIDKTSIKYGLSGRHSEY